MKGLPRDRFQSAVMHAFGGLRGYRISLDRLRSDEPLTGIESKGLLFLARQTGLQKEQGAHTLLSVLWDSVERTNYAA